MVADPSPAVQEFLQSRRVARLATALGMEVVAWTYHPSPERAEALGVRFVDLEDLLRQADVVSLNLRLSDESRGMIGERELALMKAGALLINGGRGELVDTAALVEALDSGRLGGAGLDVFEEQPTDADNPLFKLDNVVASPHVAGDDALASIDMGKEAAGCIIDLHAGRWPQGAVVNNELEGKWKW